MDDSGRMYARPEHQADLRKMVGRPVDVEPAEAAPASALPIEDPRVAAVLAGMPRRARRAFMTERRRGASEVDALASAESVLNG